MGSPPGPLCLQPPWPADQSSQRGSLCLLKSNEPWGGSPGQCRVLMEGIQLSTLCPPPFRAQTRVPTATAGEGIGKAVALELARKNARTILACRCREKGQAVAEEIRRATGNPQVQFRLLDVSSMASVRDFARRFLEEGSQLHILVNNAGVTGLPFAVTTEGLELTFATNVSGPFLLTNLLLGTMAASAPARIVNVSSFRHFSVRKMELKWLTGEEQPKNASQAYDCTKLMNVLFTVELARRLQGTGVSANVLSPGIVRTEILRHYGWASRLLYRLCSLFMKSPQKGATSTLYCAVAPEVEGISGKYFDSNCTLVQPQALAQEPGLGHRLWDALEKATGLKTAGGLGPSAMLGGAPLFSG